MYPLYPGNITAGGATVRNHDLQALPRNRINPLPRHCPTSHLGKQCRLPAILACILQAKVAFIMTLVKLQDHLKLNIPEIDSQHEELISLINLLHETMLQGADKATLDGLLAQLLEHTQTHFAYEEQLMSRYNYPGYEVHKSQHIRLLQHLVDFTDRYKHGDLLLSFAVVLELKGWALTHIENSDKPLGTFLNNLNVVEAKPV
jgi:hemerythrin-like metal-binding protein